MFWISRLIETRQEKPNYPDETIIPIKQNPEMVVDKVRDGGGKKVVDNDGKYKNYI